MQNFGSLLCQMISQHFTDLKCIRNLWGPLANLCEPEKQATKTLFLRLSTKFTLIKKLTTQRNHQCQYRSGDLLTKSMWLLVGLRKASFQWVMCSLQRVEFFRHVLPPFLCTSENLSLLGVYLSCHRNYTYTSPHNYEGRSINSRTVLSKHTVTVENQKYYEVVWPILYITYRSFISLL